MKDFIIKRLSTVGNWENVCIPAEIRKNAGERQKRTEKLDNVLNKPKYTLMDFIDFDAYGKIISRRDNWSKYFDAVFLTKNIFTYKMNIILSLRNDVRHGRRLDTVNEIRLRLHCYDVLSQIHEYGNQKTFRHSRLAKKLGLV